MIEQLIEWSLWAMTAAPFLIGKFGGGGGSPQPPQLSPQQSAELFEKQLQLQQRYLPGMVATAGTASRGQDAEAVRFGLGMLTNPSAAIYASEIGSLNQRVSDAQNRINTLNEQLRTGTATTTTQQPWFFGNRSVTSSQRLNQSQRDDIQRQIADLRQQIRANQDRVAVYNDPTFAERQLRGSLPQEFAARDRLLGDIDRARASSPEYRRAQAAMARGLTAQQANMERAQAQETNQSTIGARLMSEAMRKMDQGGRLSPEAQREAVQSARQGFAARGMATGNAALGAELLNRDRFARQREFENLGFAQGVEAQDLARRTQNTLNRQQAGMQNAQAFNQMSQFNTLQRADTGRFNIGLLGQASQMSDAERARQLSLGQDAYNFGLSTNPRMMLAGLGSPYANMTGPAMSMVSGAQGLQPMYSGGSFSRGNQGMNMIAGGLGGALSGAAMGAALGGSAGLGFGAVPGAIGGAILGLGGGLLSDEREKKNVKPLGKAGKILGLTAYKFDYKNGSKGNVGFMAQDVQKVLPEAVEEVNYKGKKRLAIKPAVIGAALASELAEAKAA